MKRILISGSMAFDLLLSYDGDFTEGIEKDALADLSLAYVTSHSVKRYGGTGANIAWNLSFLGGSPLLVSTVGSDAKDYLNALSARGISVDNVEVRHDHPTALAIIATDSQEHQITFFNPGADQKGSFPDLTSFVNDISLAIIAPRDEVVSMKAIEFCQNKGIKYLFDPGQQILTYAKDDLLRAIGGSFALFLNAYEWDLLSQRLSCNEREMLSHTSLLVITRGENGVDIIDQEQSISLPACTPQKIINPTGAGDAFRAGFLLGLSQSWNLKSCGMLGNAVASLNVECEGTQGDNVSMQEISQRIRDTYETSLPSLTQETVPTTV